MVAAVDRFSSRIVFLTRKLLVTEIDASVLDEEPPKDDKAWYEWLDRRHAYYEQERVKAEAEIAARLDELYPASEGWTGTGIQPRIRWIGEKPAEPPMWGDFI